MNSAACNFANIQRGSKALLINEFKRLNKHTKRLQELTKLDISSRLLITQDGETIFPQNIHALTKNTNPIKFDSSKITEYSNKAKRKLATHDQSIIRDHADKFNKHLNKTNPFSTFIGHFVFSVARVLITNAVSQETGKGFSISNERLSESLINELFFYSLDEDLKKIKSKLRAQLNILGA